MRGSIMIALGATLLRRAELDGEVIGAVHADRPLRAPRIPAGVGVAAWRAALGSGSAASFDRYHGDYLAAQAGIEGRVCTSTDVVCATGAVDAAAIHITQVYDPVHTGIDYTAPGGFVRAGVDVGGRRVRARLSLETGHALSHAGFVADLSLGVSVRF